MYYPKNLSDFDDYFFRKQPQFYELQVKKRNANQQIQRAILDICIMCIKYVLKCKLSWKQHEFIAKVNSTKS